MADIKRIADELSQETVDLRELQGLLNAARAATDAFYDAADEKLRKDFEQSLRNLISEARGEL